MSEESKKLYSIPNPRPTTDWITYRRENSQPAQIGNENNWCPCSGDSKREVQTFALTQYLLGSARTWKRSTLPGDEPGGWWQWCLQTGGADSSWGWFVGWESWLVPWLLLAQLRCHRRPLSVHKTIRKHFLPCVCRFPPFCPGVRVQWHFHDVKVMEINKWR